MLNQVILVGRIKEIKDYEIKLAVSRSCKNKDGKYETDVITINMTQKIGDNVQEFCHKGDILGVKGHIEKHNNIKIFADKVTFLTSHTKED